MKKGLLVMVLFGLFLSACNVPLGTATAAPTLAPLPVGSATGEVLTETATPGASATSAPAVDAPEPTKENPAPVVEPVPVQDTATAPQPTAPSLPGEDFDVALGRALEERGFDALRKMMKARFSFAYYPTQLLEFAAEESMQRMASTILADDAQPTVVWSADTAALLEGKDPLQEWGPVADVVRAMYVTGLGSSADQEALFVIGRDANGQRYFHGVLLPEGGYFYSTAPDPDAVVETHVKRVEALEILNVRSGPGSNYAVEGQMRQGEIASVSGRSADGQWWRIVCTQDASGHCWVSADEELTQPVG